MRKRFYLVLAVLGTLVPYFFFLRFLLTHGLDLPLFVRQMFANDIATFFAADLLISIAVLFVFMAAETRRLQIRGWGWCVAATFTVGLSLALPLFLYLRERSLDAQLSPATQP